MRPGWTEIILILILIVILFGHNKIPGMMRNLAGGIKVFKKELKDDKSEGSCAKESEAKKVPAKKVVTKKHGTAKSVSRKSAVKKSVKK